MTPMAQLIQQLEAKPFSTSYIRWTFDLDGAIDGTLASQDPAETGDDPEMVRFRVEYIPEVDEPPYGTWMARDGSTRGPLYVAIHTDACARPAAYQGEPDVLKEVNITEFNDTTEVRFVAYKEYAHGQGCWDPVEEAPCCDGRVICLKATLKK